MSGGLPITINREPLTRRQRRSRRPKSFQRRHQLPALSISYGQQGQACGKPCARLGNVKNGQRDIVGNGASVTVVVVVNRENVHTRSNNSALCKGSVNQVGAVIQRDEE